jgi:alanyl-tRNA synthetase
MQTQHIRRQFLKYFKERQHAVIPSSSVVPHDDQTLLFTNAGMNQFKDVFLGSSIRDYKRAATSQKCIRVGGKHNDLENVGHTSRHLTFFEMLGNFSFGDYFKKEAIQFAWEVATQVYEFVPERIWPTVFREDDEAFELWTKYVPAARITRFDEKDNFWSMGDTGPCGPCSELLFDRGANFGSATSPKQDPSGERFLEFWNLVFMQYNRNAAGVMEPLPKPSIDTGAGLERIVGLKMGVDNVFATDVLRSLIAQVEQVSGVAYNPHNPKQAPAFHVIADHLRCLSFAIADGAQPSNVDRGYVLRKVLRRAVRYGKILGMEEPFLAKVLPRLVEVMGEDYLELKKAENRIAEILTGEEEAFIRTLRRGGNILNQIVEGAQKSHQKIGGDEAFKLKDTYGLPLEEILLLAKDNGLEVDLARYEALEAEAKERSRKTQKTTQQIASENLFADLPSTEFVGYRTLSSITAVIALVVDGQFVDKMNAGDTGLIIVDKTPFYAEMGGQVGDTGIISTDNALLRVSDCQSPYKGIIAHAGKLEQGTLKVNSVVTVTVDAMRRQKIANNHTATHLLHWALHKVLGEHIKQAGSVVDPHRLRFDFSHHKALTPQEIRQVEDLVNGKIRENQPVNSYELSYEDAQKRDDIKQFFGEKYGSKVRVIDIDYSKELCGGTHTSAVGTIGLFRIAKESSIAAGVRRIEAVTGEEAEALGRESEETLNRLAEALKTLPTKLSERIEKLLEENRLMALELKQAKKGQLAGLAQTLIEKAEKVKQITLIAAELEVTPEELRLCADQIMESFKSGVLVIGAKVSDDKCSLIARVSNDLVEKGVKALDIIKAIAPIIEGSGGGKADSAQAGGKAPHKMKEAIAKVRDLL